VSITLYEASVPVLRGALRNLASVLQKGATLAGTVDASEADLLEARLAPDMFTLTRQVQSACDAAKFCAARLAGIPAPSFPDTETSFVELQARISQTLAFLDSVGPEAIDGRETEEVTLKVASGPLTFTALDYLRYFALPNFFFHAVTAYDVLRHKGIPLGKKDYLFSTAS
jgi:uncharacterized protein